MKTFLCEPCQPIYEGDGPPRIVVGDIWDGKVEIHIVEHEDEDFVDLLKAATQHRILRAALTRAEQRRRNPTCHGEKDGIIRRRGKSP